MLTDVADRIRARLLAGLLLAIVAAGFLSGVIQLALVPGFLPTFGIMNLALAALAAGYLASRTRHYRVGGAIASLAPLAACLAVAAHNPDDRVWYAFMTLGVLLASVFLSPRATVLVAVLSVTGVLAVAWAVPQLRSPDRVVPPLMFQLVFAPLMILAARHRDRLEEERQRALLESHAAQAEAQRLETAARFAGGIAHDFQNLLSVITAGVGSLRAGGAAADELDDVASASARAAALVRQLLAFSRQQALEPQLVRPADVVAGLEGILRHVAGEKVRLVVERPAGPWRVLVDPTQLEQVLLNLVVNARDAMPAGGTLRVGLFDVEVAPADPEAREGMPAGAYVALEVADTGTGMTDEVRRRIFEPFFTTKGSGGGSGIGLATVHGIVTQSGGHLTVRSAPGAGATFTVYLPRAGDSPAPDAAGREAALPLPPPAVRAELRGTAA
jgi:signal transduction histidine kinase